MPDQLDGNGIDARVARVLSHGKGRQLAIVRAWQILPDVNDVGGDEMKVVEEPFGRGRDEPPVVDILGQRAVGRAQRAGVRVETWKDAASSTAAGRVDRESRGERERALFEAPDSEQLVAKRLSCQSCLRFVLR